MNCYLTGEPCDCGAFDVAGECPHDTFVHDEDFMDEDFMDEDTIDDAYDLLKGLHDDEIERY